MLGLDEFSILRSAMRHGPHHGLLRYFGMLELRHNLAVAKNKNPVGAFNDFFKFGRDHQNAQAIVSKILDQALDFSLGPYVNAAGWLIQNEKLWVHAKPPRQQHFLLVAAG